MINNGTDPYRRAMLQAIAGVATVSQSVAIGAATAVGAPEANGKPGDFDFLTGTWRIANRRLIDKQWDEFDGEATVHALLGGSASVEELRIPARGFSGMAVRLLDVERKLWADHWISSKNGVMDTMPGWGSFVNGTGCWDTQDGATITRGIWDQITPHSCRWRQMRSSDSGRTWTENWIMHWLRLDPLVFIR